MKIENKRTATFPYYALLIVLVSSVIGCGGCKGCQDKAPPAIALTTDTTKVIFLNEAVTFCWEKPLKPQNAKVQILIDASGSMVGFSQVVHPIVNWLNHSISQLSGSSIERTDYRMALFNQPNGIFNRVRWGVQLGSFQPSGNTNLHDAIRAAVDYELTFIVTDGVAATGIGGSGDCAEGVDAACVARAMRSVIHAESVFGADVSRGIWFVPLMTTYDGTFYTEEPILPTDFNPNQTIQQIKADIGTQAVIQNPRSGSDGRLHFGYKGPRAMLIIVIARFADLGRSALQAMWNTTQLTGIQRASDFKNYSSGFVATTPIELYPGFINSVRWERLDSPTNPEDLKGTIDASLQLDKTSISIECIPNADGRGIFRLRGVTLQGTQSGCLGIIDLPGFNFKLRTDNMQDESILADYVQAYAQDESYMNLNLLLRCPVNTPRDCASNPVSSRWVAYMKYLESANCLSSPNCSHASHTQIRDLSTSRPSKEPHRIYALSATIEKLYQEVSRDQRSQVLAQLNFCTK